VHQWPMQDQQKGISEGDLDPNGEGAQRAKVCLTFYAEFYHLLTF